jgi:hypothetical protein
MAQKISPFLQSKYGWDFGESGWNTGMDENLLKFSFLFDGNVDGLVSSLPIASNGQAYFLETDNRLYFSVNSIWYSTPTPKWFIFRIKTTGETYQFDGSSAVQVDSIAEVQTKLLDLEGVINSLGTAAFESSDSFVAPSQLDVAEANAAAYTDAARYVQNFPDVATVRLAGAGGRFDGDVAYLLSYYSGSQYGGGLLKWDAVSSEVDNGVTVFAVSGIDVGRWKRPESHTLTVDDAGLLHEETPTTDQTSQVEAFLASASSRPLVVGRAIRVGINDTISIPSSLHWLANGFELFTLSSFAGDAGFRVVLKHEDCENVYVESLVVNGNATAFGGLYPVVTGDIPRGVAVMGGCKNIEYKYTQAVDVVGNAFIHLSGGAYEKSEEIRFTSCVATNCGLGFGQEIKQGVQITSDGPGTTVYDNCVADLCNFGLYLAGGDARVVDGHYHSKRQQALTCYTGDGHAKTTVHLSGKPVFEMTPEVGQNDLAYIHCINKQTVAPNYQLQQELFVTGDQPHFICNHGGINLAIEEGSNLSFLAPVFVGGASCVRTVKSTFTGPYKQGNICLGAADMSDFSADGIRANLKLSAVSPSFYAPSTTTAQSVLLLDGADVTLYGPSFGSSASGVNQPVSGVRTDVSGTKLVVRDSKDYGVSGTLFSATLANATNWLIENSPTSATSIVVRDHIGSATYDPPSLADGAGVTTTVSVPGANLGDFAFASFSQSLQGVTVTAFVSSANTVSVRFQNETGAAIDLTSGTIFAKSMRPV